MPRDRIETDATWWYLECVKGKETLTINIGPSRKTAGAIEHLLERLDGELRIHTRNREATREEMNGIKEGYIDI